MSWIPNESPVDAGGLWRDTLRPAVIGADCPCWGSPADKGGTCHFLLERRGNESFGYVGSKAWFPSQGELNPIETSVPGIQISEIFPQLAKQMHHCALVRSIAGTQGDHGLGTYNVQTSYLQTPNIVHPGFGSVVVHEKPKMGDLPSFVSISGRAPRASYLGQACEAYFVGAPGERDPYLAFPEGITQVRGNDRLDALARFNDRYGSRNPGESNVATKTAIDDAVKLMRSPALSAFELDKVPTTMLNRYGDNTFGRGVLLAKQLVETGVRFVQVNRGGSIHTRQTFQP